MTDSHRRGIERLLFFYPKSPYRCKECWTRFWKAKNPVKGIGLIAALLLIPAVAVAVYFFMFRNGEEPDDSGSAGRTVPPRTTTTIAGRASVTTTLPSAASSETTPPDAVSYEDKEISDAEQLPEIPLGGKEVPPKPQKGEIVETDLSGERMAGKPAPLKPVASLSDGGKRPEAFSSAKPSRVSLQPKASTGAFSLDIKVGRPVREYTHFGISEFPPKVVVDIPGKWEYPGYPTLRVKSDIVRQVRIGEHEEKLRLVLDLKGRKPLVPVIRETSEGLSVSVKK